MALVTFFEIGYFSRYAPAGLYQGEAGTRGFVVGGYCTSTERETRTWIGRYWENVGDEVDSRLHGSEVCGHSALSNPNIQYCASFII